MSISRRIFRSALSLCAWSLWLYSACAWLFATHAIIPALFTRFPLHCVHQLLHVAHGWRAALLGSSKIFFFSWLVTAAVELPAHVTLRRISPLPQGSHSLALGEHNGGNQQLEGGRSKSLRSSFL